MQTKIDFSFLKKKEGRIQLAYVPKNKDGIIGNSGVTIATGVDLGQRNSNDIRALRISEALKQKLIPYCGLRREEALKFVLARPLVLSWAEVDELDQAVIEKDLTRAIRLYNEASKIPFLDLPPQAQTVYASLAWNFGLGNLMKMKNTWKFLITQDWKELAKLLSDFPSKQPALDKRRKSEAALLKTI